MDLIIFFIIGTHRKGQISNGFQKGENGLSKVPGQVELMKIKSLAGKSKVGTKENDFFL